MISGWMIDGGFNQVMVRHLDNSNQFCLFSPSLHKPIIEPFARVLMLSLDEVRPFHCLTDEGPDAVERQQPGDVKVYAEQGVTTTVTTLALDSGPERYV
jgi:hypothetical protein